jgi:putative transposase
VWTTRLRYDDISPEIEKYLFTFLENKTKRFDCVLHGIGGTVNHVHLVLEIPPAVLVADIIGKLKGSSSYFLNKELGITKDFKWQNGYGVLTFAERDLAKVLRYVQNQKQHHLDNELNNTMETTTEDE